MESNKKNLIDLFEKNKLWSCSKFVLSLVAVSCKNVIRYEQIIYGNALLFVFQIALYYFVFCLFEKIGELFIDYLNKNDRINKTKYFCFFIILIISYSVFLFIYYPGTFGWDTTNQIIDYIDGITEFSETYSGPSTIANLNNHHPFLDTLVFGFFFNLNRSELGIFLYTFIQITLFSALFAWVLTVMQGERLFQTKKPHVLIKLTLFFWAFMPFVDIYVITILKDTLFSIMFIMYFVNYLLFIRKPNNKNIIALIFLSILVSVTKKTGIYIVIISNILLLFSDDIKIIKKYLIYIISSFLLPILIIFVFFPKIIFPKYNIYPGGPQDMYGTLFQQTARTVVLFEEEFTENEREKINKVFDYDIIKSNYDNNTTDPIKNTYRLDVRRNELIDYFKIWLKHGVKHPIVYMQATLGTCGGFFTIDKPINYYNSMAGNDILNLNNNIITKNLRVYIDNLYNYMTELPLLGLLFQIVIYIWWIPIWTLLVGIKHKDKKICLMLTPIIVSILMLIVSPYTGHRYAIHQIFVSPIVLYLGIMKSADNKNVNC